VLAYTLGLRHAFDADHISAIDNCTRKVLGERQGTGAPRPLGFGFFFSLGHSTVVVAIGAGIVVAEKTVFGAVSDNASGLERFGGLFGTVVSAAFLLLIGLLNLVVLAGIVRVFASMRRGEYDEAELEQRGRCGSATWPPVPRSDCPQCHGSWIVSVSTVGYSTAPRASFGEALAADVWVAGR